ncbi:choice-of-anchor M domain-containing protein [Corynebacterium sp.]|uniref:choice-of-anchor M domain-containing protein n=1 Tax=Corynebacterium sp. TaxID=1720 RepID=UPI0026DCFBFE|nr:choice-of-anchor M domain-containing protein [Corynebacterium sp.]MDO5031484.1 choice-of-anchor M domain-containing protein [Corynebacterium sp.]
MYARDSLSRPGLTRVPAALAACLAAALLLLHAALTPLLPAAQAQEQIFDSGHVDAFYVTAPGGELTLSLKEDITGHGVEHAGGDVVLAVSEQAWSSATENIPDIGAPTYFLPQTQQAGILWPGWDTQAAQEAGYRDVDLDFLDVSGPGAVYAFETAGFGDIQAVTSSGSMELASGDAINQPYPAHRHINWAFSEPGTYTMTVQASSNGDASNEVTYTWQVGDAAASADAVLDDATSAGADPNSDATPGAADGSAGTVRGAAAGTGAGAQRNSAAQRDSQHQAAEKKRAGAAPHPAQQGLRHGAGQEDPEAAGYYYAAEQRDLLPWGVGLAGLGMLALGLAIARLALAKARE